MSEKASKESQYSSRPFVRLGGGWGRGIVGIRA